MKRMKFLLAGLALVGAVNAFAQESPSKRGLSLSLGPDVSLPLGTFHSTSGYKFGIGGSAKLAIPVATYWDVTAGAGYMGFSGSKLNTVADKNTFTIIPFQAGIRYRTPSGFYVEPQAGFTQTKLTNAEGSGQFSYAFNLGYLINRVVDISLGYNGINAKDQTISGVTQKGESAKFLELKLHYNLKFARVRQ
jgi:hypothetical protein